MKARSVWPGVLCAFIVGIFVGIWLDSSAWQKKFADRNLIFEVQPYQMANLEVHPGDTLSLDIPRGGTGTATLNWIGSSPCPNDDGSNCTVASSAPNGPYFFNCNSQNYSCPDPGVQQGPAPPGLYPSFGKILAVDFAHLFGVTGGHREHHPQPPTRSGPGPANASITAIASCVNGQAALQDPNGVDLTTINVPVHETVYWVDPNGFTLDLSQAPSNLCTGGNPAKGPYAPDVSCKVDQSEPSVSYTITPNGSPACSPLQATLNTIPPAKQGGKH